MEVSGQSLSLKVKNSFLKTYKEILKKYNRLSQNVEPVDGNKQLDKITSPGSSKDYFSFTQESNPNREEIEKLSICIRRKRAWLLKDSIRESIEDAEGKLEEGLPEELLDGLPEKLKEGLPEELKEGLLEELKEVLPEELKEASSVIENDSCLVIQEVFHTVVSSSSIEEDIKNNISIKSNAEDDQQKVVNPEEIMNENWNDNNGQEPIFEIGTLQLENVNETPIPDVNYTDENVSINSFLEHEQKIDKEFDEQTLIDSLITKENDLKNYRSLTNSVKNKQAKRFDYLSKAKSVQALEIKIHEKMREAQKLSFIELPTKSSQILAMALEECLREVSKHSCIWGDTLLKLAMIAQSLRKQIISFDNQMTVLQMANQKRNFESNSLVLVPRERLLRLTKQIDQEKMKNEELVKIISDLEDVSSDDRVNISDEKKRRRVAETDLMLATLEAQSLRRKLNTFLKGGPETDPHLLQIALKKCQEELSKRTRRLQDIELHYKDVVPRADLERYQKRFTILSQSHEKLTVAHDQIKHKLETLVEVHENICNERDIYSCENESLRMSATPRPEWNRVAEHIEGGISRWHEMASGRTSDQLLDLVVSELTGMASSSSAEYLSCQGTDEVVPPFLRYDGCVRNKRLGKREVLLIIQDVWKERRNCLEGFNLGQFLDKYFKERYHLDEVRAEWCYSLADACQRLAHEEQIGLFWGILCAQVQEDVYHFQEQTIEDLYRKFISKDAKNKGIISADEIDDLLQQHFPLKSEMALDELKNIVKKATSAREPSLIKYRHLFVQDESRMLSGTSRLPIARSLIRQAREEQEIYVSEILREFKPSAVDVSVKELRRAFTIVDPLIEQVNLEAYILWVFNVTKVNLCDVSPISLPLLVARLQTGHIVRIGKRII